MTKISKYIYNIIRLNPFIPTLHNKSIHFFHSYILSHSCLSLYVQLQNQNIF